MLKKQNRLKSSRAFYATYNNNCSVSEKSIVLYLGYKKDDKNCPTRVGFVVSKKIHKRAVIRNKIKRALRENVRLLIKEREFIEDYKSLIFIARPSITDKKYIDIKSEIFNLISKVANKNI